MFGLAAAAAAVQKRRNWAIIMRGEGGSCCFTACPIIFITARKCRGGASSAEYIYAICPMEQVNTRAMYIKCSRVACI